MPSFADSAVIFILALILFGPKKLPQLAKQLGKLMAEFRRASNEFRMQMEDELRIEEQKEHEAKVAAMAGPPSTVPEPEHLPSPDTEAATAENAPVEHITAPIAESGELKMMPPSTGLPVESAAFGTTRDVFPAGDTQPVGEEHNILPPDHGAHTGTSHPVEGVSDTATGVSDTAVGVSSEEPHHESMNA